MARPLRVERAGAWYHVTARGNERSSIFRDDRDRRHFCDLLAELTERFRFALRAYVLMENHYHLMVETREANLSRAMQWLNVSYSVWFNRRHGRVGHLFQGRYKAIIVDRDAWAWSLSRYVHLNPVRVAAWGLDKEAQRRVKLGVGGIPDANTVRERIERLRRYRWSSYPAYAGLSKAPNWLGCDAVLDLQGGRRRDEQRRAYRDEVEATLREGLQESPWRRLIGQVVLGSQDFLRRLQIGLQGDDREQPALRSMRARPGFAQVVAVVERLKGEEWGQFRNRHGDWGRDLVPYLGTSAGALKLRELGEACGGMDYAGVSMAVKRFAQRAAQDGELATLLARAKGDLLNVET